MRSKSSTRSLAATMIVMLVCNGLYLMLFLPFEMESTFRLLGVTPVVTAVALVSYPDVQWLIQRVQTNRTPFNEVDLLFTYFSSVVVFTLAGLARSLSTSSCISMK